MSIPYMYPEGWLIDPEGKSLFYFEEDPMNPLHEGYIGLWILDELSSKNFRYRKRISRSKALTKWRKLHKQGWRIIQEKELVA